ncbi:Tyrosine-protein kinase Wzc [Rhodococcus wratislaviensis]|uniref:non-specific protein-tyrosine kinase n=1 Tax=Rhodococcus wratislaviensis TaxID=44752 RepID=A0A402BYA7_RHOWR|nr:polysaccharide biosynthesis tyrosine autokinase [Rhodococcus wratislaviensis]GCE36403.1 Tyrosine-protein kinase Wzc [Rhodococcus wratislaviensis]
MKFEDYLRILRAHWIIVATCVLLVTLGAVVASYLVTPRYAASTRLFVSVSGASSTPDVVDAQQRVTSYTQLLAGENLAQRTIDALNLNMSAKDLAAEVRATSTFESVLIDVTVEDASPGKAATVANELSNQFVQLVSELETPANGGQSAARVVVEHQASVPDAPVYPRKKLGVALGMALGLIAGAGLAILRDRMDNTVRSNRDVEEAAGSEVIGTLPYDDDRPGRTASDQSGIGSSAASLDLRTNLQFRDTAHPPRAFVVTSTSRDEGKTAIAVDIALALADAGMTVALIDGDARSPHLTTYLGLEDTVGVSDVLEGDAPLEKGLQQTRFDEITLLPAGQLPPKPSALLGSEAFQEIMAELRSQFDYVIVDSPPLFPFTDAAVLASHSDGVVLVARTGVTDRRQLADAVAKLRSLNLAVLGVVTVVRARRRRLLRRFRSERIEE